MIKSLPIIGAIIGLAVLTALGIYLTTTSHQQDANKTIIRWAVDPHPIRSKTIALFEKRNPKIHVINDPDASQQRLLTQIAGGVPADVIALYNPDQVRSFARHKLLLDLRPYVAKYHIPVDDLYPQLRPLVYYGKQIVALPENSGTYNLFYNKKLFREAGVPYPRRGWTWQDCLNAAIKLTKYKTIAGRKVPVQKGIYVADAWWPYFVYNWGGRIFTPDGKRCLLDSKEAKAGIRFMADMKLKYHVAPSSSEAQSLAPTGSYGGDFLLFSQGKVAMVVIGRFMISQYRLQKNLDWEVAYMPKGPFPTNIYGGKSYGIPRTSRHKDAAVKFVLHIISKENQGLIADFGDGIPTRRNKEIVKNFLYNPEYPKETHNQVYLDEVPGSHAEEVARYISQVDFNAITTIEFGRMWLGEESADQACDNIARRVNAVIRRNIANPNFLQ